jgi:hypothetical protein
MTTSNFESPKPTVVEARRPWSNAPPVLDAKRFRESVVGPRYKA